MDCLELAADARALDMRASPYDLRDYGFAADRRRDAGGSRRIRPVPSRASLTRAAPLRASAGRPV